MSRPAEFLRSVPEIPQGDRSAQEQERPVRLSLVPGTWCAFERAMRFALAFFLLAHGVAHLVGFVSSWKLATLAELPYKTTIFSGRIDVGDAGIRVLGVLWLLAALAFLVAASAVATSMDWASRFMLAAVLASLMLCVVGWPDARIGVAVNVGLVLLLAFGARLNLPVS